MRIVFAVVLLLPFLLTGCLEIFFGAPMELGSFHGWKLIQHIHSNADSNTEIAAVFNDSGQLFCAYTTGSETRVVRVSPQLTLLNGGSLGNTTGLDMVFNPTDRSVYVACCSNTDAKVYSWYESAPRISRQVSPPIISKLSLAWRDGTMYLAGSTASDLFICTNSTGGFFQLDSFAGFPGINSIDLMVDDNPDCFLYLGSSAPPDLLRRYFSGGSNVYSESNSFTGAVSARALFHPDATIFHTAIVDSSGTLTMRWFSRDYPTSGWDTSSATPASNISHLSMAMQDQDPWTMFVGFDNDSADPDLQNRVTVLRRNPESNIWEPYAPAAASPHPVGNFTLVVNPQDGKLWMICTTPMEKDSLLYALRAFRYDP